MNRQNAQATTGWTRKAAWLTVVLAALVISLSGCATIPAQSTSSSESVPTMPPADAATMLPDPDERHVCGQASALQGIWYRSDWEHDQG